MATKKRPTPPSCDYEPIPGEVKEISFGVVEAIGDPPRRLEDVIGKRWFPTERPANLCDEWPEPTAIMPEVLLTKGAPDHFSSVRHLCGAYHSKPGNQIQHLAAQITIRFPGVDEVPQQLRLHEARELGRGFGLRLVSQLQAAAAFCMHVPATSWGYGPPHCHLVIPARHVLSGSGFGRFISALVNPEEGRALIDSEWLRWSKENGYAL
jgi:hypothetical protein